MIEHTEVMKQALEALEDVQYYGWGQTERDYDARTAAITAIREALTSVPDWASEAKEQPACEHEWLRGACLKCGQSIEQLAQQQYQSTADKCELTPVPAKGGLLPAQQEQKMTYQQAAQLINEMTAQQQQEPVAWRELCRRLYVELYWCDRQMMETLDEDGEPVWTQGQTVRDVLADAKAALETSPPASKPLTDEEIKSVIQSIDPAEEYLPRALQQFARAIEAKLKEKNA